MATVDWINIKNEYITCNISYRKLSNKYNVSYDTLKCRAVREHWKDQRDKAHDKITAITLQNTVNKMAERKSDILMKELDAADDMADIILQTVKDRKQFNRHLVVFKCGRDSHTEERVFGVVDTKRLKIITDALLTITEIKCQIMDIIDAGVRLKLDIERQRLEYGHRKFSRDYCEDDDSNEMGIVFIPSVDLELYESQNQEALQKLIVENDSQKLCNEYME